MHGKLKIKNIHEEMDYIDMGEDMWLNIRVDL